MAITRTGAFFEDGTSFIYGFSDASGRLEVSNGHVLSLESASGVGPFLAAGGPGGGPANPAALGEIIVRGTGSVLEVLSGGSPVEGASLSVAFGEGTRGLMQVLDGASFRIEDPSGPDNSDNSGGGEVAWIGRGPGAEGQLEVIGGDFRLTGTGTSLQVGRDGGTGSLRVADGADLVVETTSAGGEDFTNLIIGRHGGTGSAEIAGAFALVQAGLNGGGAVDVGRQGGTGSLEISGSAEAPNRDGLFLVGNAYSPFVEMRVGHQDGIGSVTMDGGSLAVVNSGVEVLREGGSTPWQGPGEKGGSARLSVGRADGTGNLEAEGGAIFVGGRESAELALGVDGGTGQMRLDGAAMTLRSFAQNAGMMIGEWQSGDAEGTLVLENGATLRAEGHRSAFASVGRWEGNDGTLRVESGSTLALIADVHSADLNIGRSGATGAVHLTDSTLEMAAPMRDGDGAPLGDTFAWVLVGTEAGTGTLVFDNTQANIAAGQGAGFRIGTRWSDTEDNTGTGSVVLRNGSVVYAEALLEGTNFWVGGGAGSDGTARILSGSVLDLSGNGWVPVGYASPGLTPGGTGLLEIDGAGSLLTGAQSMTVGGRGSEGMVRISDGARALIGGLDVDRSVFVDFGWRADSRGELVMTNALMSVQAGTAENAGQPETGAGVNIGVEGATGLADITGARATDPDAPHGLIVLGNAESDFAFIDIGRGEGSDGTVHVRGAFFGAQNDGTTFGADGPIDLDGNGGYAAVRIGREGGTGSLDIGGNAELFAISGGDDSAEILVGRGDDAAGVLNVSDTTQVDIIARRFDAWLLAGTEGGASGTVTITDSSVLIDAARNGGIRLGTSWFNTPDQVGTGRLTLEDGTDVTIRAQGSGANFFVGGGAGSDAQATLRDATVTMEGDAHRLVIVGGTPAFLPGTGGRGEMLLEGAEARLEGARDILVGTNTGTGRLELRDGAQIALEDAGGGFGGSATLAVGIGRVRADEPESHTWGVGDLVLDGANTRIDVAAADLARMFLGTNVGTGHAVVRDGAQIALDGAVSVLNLGTDSGEGWLDIAGAGTRIDLTGDDARIRIGQLINPEAAIESSARGVLRIDEGATVRADTMVEVGDASTSEAWLVMAGGDLVTPRVELAAGYTVLNNTLMGHGRIIGTDDQPALVMDRSSFYVGDDLRLYSATSGLTGPYSQETGTGLLEITGSVVAQSSGIYFDIGGDGGGYDQIEVTGAFNMAGGNLQMSALEGAGALLSGGGLRLIAASDGIVLQDVDVIGTLPNGTAIETELRNNGTELWAFLGAPAEPGEPVTEIPLPPGWRDWLDWIGGGGSAPPPPPATGRADTIADPHLVTLDGLAYDFHAAGEFVLLRALEGPFQVQARMAPVAADASENVAAAVQLSGGRVMVDATTPDSVLVNGNVLALAAGESATVGTDLVWRTGDTWHLVHRHGNPDGEVISTASITVVDGRLDITVFADESLAGRVEGLLGNFDGDPDTDLALRDGRLVARPLRFGDDPETGELGLYGAFRDEWRISDPSDSLFTYAPGEGPDSFYLPDYPARMLTLEDFDADAVAAARAAVTAAGLEPGTVAHDNALFDLLATGNPAYVEAAVTFQTQQETRPETAPPIAAPEVTGGALDGLISLSGQILGVGGGALDGVEVRFTASGRSVSHIRGTDGDGAFGFDLLPGAGGVVQASRAYDPATDGRVSALDALDVLRLAVGLAPSFGDATPEAFIAADINRDGAVTALDALEVLRAAVGLATEHAPQWVFVDADADMSGAGRSNVPLDTGLQLAAIDAAMGGVTLTGILTGHMSEFA